jgi:uncharacterized protein YxjI
VSIWPFRRRRPVLRDAALAGASTGSTRYLLGRRSTSAAEDMAVFTDTGHPLFRIARGQAEANEAVVLRDARGSVLFTAAAGAAEVDIRRPGGQLAAHLEPVVSEANPGALEIEIVGGPRLRTRGDLRDHEYRIERGRSPVAVVSKRWSTPGDGYVAQVLPGQDHGLLLAVVLGIDALAAHEA